MVRLSLLLLLLTFVALAGSSPEYDSASRKIDSIAKEQVPRGAEVRLTPAEVNAFAAGRIAEKKLEGIRNPEVRLREGALTWAGLVNFSKLPQLAPLANNFLLSRVLQGEKPVTIDVQMQSGGGKATVNVERVDISGTTFQGATLAFLVQQILSANFPDAKIGEPFDLDHNVEAITLRPQGIFVKIAN